MPRTSRAIAESSENITSSGESSWVGFLKGATPAKLSRKYVLHTLTTIPTYLHHELAVIQLHSSFCKIAFIGHDA